MKETIKSFMDQSERDNPDHKKHNNDAIDDLFSHGTASPGKPFAIEVAMDLDGHKKNRKTHRGSYDNNLHREDRMNYDHVFQDLSHRSLLLADPAFILDRSDEETITEDRELAREQLEYLIKKQAPHKQIMSDVYEPILKSTLDAILESTPITKKLAEAMTVDTKHHHSDYDKRFTSFLLHPGVDDHNRKWEHSLNKHRKHKK